MLDVNDTNWPRGSRWFHNWSAAMRRAVAMVTPNVRTDVNIGDRMVHVIDPVTQCGVLC